MSASEPRAADHEDARPRQCNHATPLLLHRRREGERLLAPVSRLPVLNRSSHAVAARRDVPQPCHGLHSADGVWHVAALRKGQEDLSAALHEGAAQTTARPPIRSATQQRTCLCWLHSRMPCHPLVHQRGSCTRTNCVARSPTFTRLACATATSSLRTCWCTLRPTSSSSATLAGAYPYPRVSWDG